MSTHATDEAPASPASVQDSPGPLAPTATTRFASSDGTELYGEWFAVDKPRAAALVIHGYQEHCGRYRELAHVLTQAGIASFTYDMRGHGRAEGQRSYIAGIGDYLDDLDAALATLGRQVEEIAPGITLPRIIVAHSNGALILLRALTDPARAPAPLAAAVLSSPFLGLKHKVSAVKHMLGKLTGRWMPTLSLPSDIPIEHLTSDPDKQHERRLDTLCNDVASSGWYLAAQEAQLHIAAYIERIELPTLWLVAGADRVADATVTRGLRPRLRASATYHELDGMEHEVFNERERGRVFGLLRDFLDQVLTPA
jgi:alpha-beta hydrolase superfamily lysophospholipase